MGKWEKRNREHWVANGLCTRCGTIATPGYRRCEKHRALSAKNKKARRERKLQDKTLCITCFRKRDTHRKECSICAKKSSFRSKRNSPIWSAKKAEIGHCKRCGHKMHDDMDGGYKTCISCREWRSNMRISRRDDDTKYRFVTGKA